MPPALPVGVYVGPDGFTTDIEEAIDIRGEAGAGNGAREFLTGPLTLYVREDGSDSNDGRADSAGGAFLTPQAAYNTIAATLDLGGQTVTVQLRDGTYGGVDINQPWTGGGKVIFRGNNSTPSNVKIAATSDHCFDISSPLPGVLQILDLKMSTATSGSCIYVRAPAVVEFGNVDFGPAALYHIITNGSGANAISVGDYVISGGAICHWVAAALGFILDQLRNISLSGTPAFQNGFAYASRSGVMTVNANTFSGPATGPRYAVDTTAVLFTNGGGASYLPGDSAGSESTGGIYN